MKKIIDFIQSLFRDKEQVIVERTKSEWVLKQPIEEREDIIDPNAILKQIQNLPIYDLGTTVFFLDRGIKSGKIVGFNFEVDYNRVNFYYRVRQMNGSCYFACSYSPSIVALTREELINKI
jgi:hypothetical protein